MNKKLIAIICVVLFGVIQPVVAMHGKIFRAMQVATSSAVIGTGIAISHYTSQQYDNLDDMQNNFQCRPASPKVTQFVHGELAKLDVPNYSKIPVLEQPWSDSNYSVFKDKVIIVDWGIAAGIETGNEEVIQEGKPILKHEAKHLLNKDCKKGVVYAPVVIPCVVQAVSSGSSYIFNKIFKRQTPKAIPSLVGRSLMATGAIVPKGLLSATGFIMYRRYQETEADRFACDHAEYR